MNFSKAWYFAALASFVICIAYSLVLSSDIATSNNLESVGARVIIQYTLASALMLIVWQGLPRIRGEFSATVSLLLVGVISRLVLVLVDPYTSNDVARYLFDGRIALAGFDPYQIPHNAPELSELRKQWAPPPEHAKYVTLYPPLALALFSFAASFGADMAISVWRAITLAASLLVLMVAYRVLKRANKLQHLPLIALSPLLILEAGEGLHLDVITALVVLLAVHCWQHKRIALLGLCIAVGGLLKMLPMVLLLPFFIALNHWRERLLLVFSAIGVWLSGYAISFLLGFKPVGSIAVFFEKWRSGSALFLWLEPQVSPQNMLIIVACLIVIGFASLAAYLWVQKFKSKGSINADVESGLYLSMQFALALPLLVSPVIFPWYLLPVVALVALRPNLLVILWSISIPLLYQVLSQFLCCQYWAPAEWPVHLIGGGLVLSAVIPIALSLSKRRLNQSGL